MGIWNFVSCFVCSAFVCCVQVELSCYFCFMSLCCLVRFYLFVSHAEHSVPLLLPYPTKVICPSTASYFSRTHLLRFCLPGFIYIFSDCFSPGLHSVLASACSVDTLFLFYLNFCFSLLVALIIYATYFCPRSCSVFRNGHVMLYISLEYSYSVA